MNTDARVTTDSATLEATLDRRPKTWETTSRVPLTTIPTKSTALSSLVENTYREARSVALKAAAITNALNVSLKAPAQIADKPILIGTYSSLALWLPLPTPRLGPPASVFSYQSHSKPQSVCKKTD